MTSVFSGGNAAWSRSRGTADISGAVTAVLVRYVRSRTGSAGLEQLLALAGEGRPLQELENPASWSPHDAAVALFQAGARITGDPMIGVRVGEEMLRQHDGTELANRLRALGSPAALLHNVTAATERFNTVATVEPLEVGEAHAVVRSAARPGHVRNRHLCDFTKGILSQVPVLFGLIPAVITEAECQAHGGRFCLYSVAWEARQWSSFVDARSSLFTTAWTGDPSRDPARMSSTDVDVDVDVDVAGDGPGGTTGPGGGPGADAEATIRELADQLAQMGERLEGVFSTVTELLGEEDITTLLGRITSRAAHAVSAPQYLLVARTAPDAPVQLHHSGFKPEEAQALANELWREHPDDAGGSRLIADITSSRRRYGRLAAVHPPGFHFVESERQILRLYASYAATALDMVTALEDARRNDATARALLEFSRALSRTTSTEEAAQQLADIVPLIIGCQHATVMLWDSAREEVTVRARTAEDPGPLPGDATNPLLAPLGTRELAPKGPRTSIKPSESPLLHRMVEERSLAVVDRDTDDPRVRSLLEDTDTSVSVVAPLCTGDEFLGVVAANFRDPVDDSVLRSKDLQGRLLGLADQAVTSFQNVRLLEQISHMAWHDPLTGLPNRRLLEDRVNQELVRARRVGESLCMFFIDMDHFKAVNDTLGHAGGDELIRQVARRLCDTVRRQDTVSRIGGDEFAVLLPGLGDLNAIEHLARRALESLSAPYVVQGKEVRTSASIGIALSPHHADTYEGLFNRADKAMYSSKDLGRNTFQLFSEAEARAEIESESTLRTELERAIERRELFVLFQPYIDLQTSKVLGVEALVRWQHPTRGVLEPLTFIPLAEQSDAIVELDAWVLRESSRQIRCWIDKGLPALRLSVNMASRDLASPTLVDTVARALEDAALDPELLEFEITGRIILDEDGSAQDNINALKAMGVRFSIADFGSASSSVNRIGTFPVSTLKIDRSFVQVLGPEDNSGALVSAIITMAQRLGLHCVAEGVETSQQGRILLQRGCAIAQGFFVSPPLHPADMERLLEDGIDPVLTAAVRDSGGPDSPG